MVAWNRALSRLECTYYAFGKYDLVQIIECPDNVSAASIAIAASAGGALKAAKTTPLMTVEEGINAWLLSRLVVL